MRRLVLDGPAKSRWEGVDAPGLASAKAALARLAAVATCDLDVAVLRARYPFPGPTPSVRAARNRSQVNPQKAKVYMSVAVERLGPVTLLTLNRPKQHNAVNVEMAVAIAEAIDAFADDDEARVMVVTGAGDRAFSTGGDVATLLQVTPCG